MVHLQVAVIVRLPDLAQQLLQLLDLHLAGLLEVLVQEGRLDFLALPPEVRRHFDCPTLEGAELEDQVRIIVMDKRLK